MYKKTPALLKCHSHSHQEDVVDKFHAEAQKKPILEVKCSVNNGKGQSKHDTKGRSEIR